MLLFHVLRKNICLIFNWYYHVKSIFWIHVSIQCLSENYVKTVTIVTSWWKKIVIQQLMKILKWQYALKSGLAYCNSELLLLRPNRLLQYQLGMSILLGRLSWLIRAFSRAIVQYSLIYLKLCVLNSTVTYTVS